MELHCVDYSAFAVSWKQLGAPQIKVITTSDVTLYGDGEPYSFKIYTSQDPDIYLTWEWEENTYMRTWLTEVGLKSAYSHVCGQPWHITRYFQGTNATVEFVKEDGTALRFIPEPGSFDEQHGATPNVYQTLQYILFYYNECQPFTYGLRTIDASINSMVAKEGRNSQWNLKIYKEDELIAEHNVWGQMYQAPTEYITTYDNEGFLPQQKIFDKVPFTEGIKLEKVPDENYQHQVIKVYLDEQQNPIGEEIIYIIHGDEPEIFCYDIGVCPENTCTVECGDTICCYNNQGYAVTQFPKPQS